MRQGVLQSIKFYTLGAVMWSLDDIIFSINVTQERNSRVGKCGPQFAG
jgi:hypothetical protein